MRVDVTDVPILSTPRWNPAIWSNALPAVGPVKVGSYKSVEAGMPAFSRIAAPRALFFSSRSSTRTMSYCGCCVRPPSALTGTSRIITWPESVAPTTCCFAGPSLGRTCSPDGSSRLIPRLGLIVSSTESPSPSALPSSILAASSIPP